MTNSEKVLVEKLNQIIENNFENSSFTTENLCSELGVSRSQLYRFIKEKYDLSISLYIRKQKIKKAKDLLENSELKISEISYKIGIDSPQNFSKYFTQEFTVSPSEFRKNVNNDIEIVETKVEKLILNNHFAPKKNTQFILGIGIVLILIVSYLFYSKYNNDVVFAQNQETISTKTNEYSIAILPFKNLGKPENSYFSEGIMEQIHGSISTLEQLKVISKTSSNKFENTKKSIQQIASELHVKYILVGSVLQIDDKVRIGLELINAVEDRSIWTKSFDGDSKDIFNFMPIVAKDVAKALSQKLSSTTIQKLRKIPTQNLAAYNAFLQGQQLLRTRNLEKVKASITKFKEATALDSNFAEAYAYEALSYYLLGEDFVIDVPTAFKLAEKNALTAIRLDSENGRAYAVLGNIYKSQNKWEQALTTYQIALKFDPNDAEINFWYSLALRSIGQMDEAIKFSTKAIGLDPLANNVYGGYIIVCSYAGKFEQAEKAIKEGNLIFDNSYLFHNAKALNFIALKKYNEALVEFSICKKLDKTQAYTDVMIAYLKAKLGEPTFANQILKKYANSSKNYSNIALLYAGLNDTENCLKYLELGAQISTSPNYLKVAPFFKFLHGNARFNAVLKKLGLLDVKV